VFLQLQEVSIWRSGGAPGSRSSQGAETHGGQPRSGCKGGLGGVQYRQ
jgi:hypothetical protein